MKTRNGMEGRSCLGGRRPIARRPEEGNVQTRSIRLKRWGGDGGSERLGVRLEAGERASVSVFRAFMATVRSLDSVVRAVGFVERSPALWQMEQT